MKGYFRYFAIPFAIVLVLGLVTIGFKVASGSDTLAESCNTERDTAERVFDYAEVLSEEEEDWLRQQIEEDEYLTQSDIVLVTLDETLIDYVKDYEDQIGTVPASKRVMVYADNFYDEHNFGYEKPHGSGVLFLDNVYREEDGNVYSWMSTSGRAMDTFSLDMIDSVLQSGLVYADDSLYEMYSTWIDSYADEMKQEHSAPGFLGYPVILIVSVVIAAIFIGVNLSGKTGKKTVLENTYVAGGKPNLKKKEDRFINKTVTKTEIPKSNSSSSGGGGSHVSSSGCSHGGGGCSR